MEKSENKENVNLEVAEKKSILNQILSILVPLLLGGLIIFFLLRDTNFDELWAVFKKANWGFLGFSLLFGLAGNTMKAFRWRLFIRPLGYEPSIINLIFATWGSFAVNFLIPRAGEVWKSGAITKSDNIPFTKTFGTMLVDRIFDTLIVIVITFCVFFLNMNFFIEQLSQNKELFDKIHNIVTSPLLYLSLIGLVAIIYITFKFFGETKYIKKVKDLFNGIVGDLKSIWKMDDKIWILIYTIIAWVLYFCYLYVAFFAFEFTKDLGVMAGLIAFTLGSLSMAIPTQGGLGPWQVAVIAALALYNVDRVEATAFATGVFSVQSLWVISWGVVGIVALAVNSKRKKKAKLENK